MPATRARTKRKRKETVGDCYRRAFMALFEAEHQRLWDAFGQAPVLVHGYPRFLGKGQNFGQKYGHAWLECGPFVVDCGCVEGDEVHAVPASEYFRVGKILLTECRRYSRAEALDLASANDGAVFWHEPPADALFA